MRNSALCISELSGATSIDNSPSPPSSAGACSSALGLTARHNIDVLCSFLESNTTTTIAVHAASFARVPRTAIRSCLKEEGKNCVLMTIVSSISLMHMHMCACAEPHFQPLCSIIQQGRGYSSPIEVLVGGNSTMYCDCGSSALDYSGTSKTCSATVLHGQNACGMEIYNKGYLPRRLPQICAAKE